MTYRIFLYRVVLAVLFPALIVFSLFHRRHRGNLLDRLGLRNSPDPDPEGILLHAVSVGEVLAVRTLIGHLRESYPAVPLTVTTVTMTGQNLAAGGKYVTSYLPFDYGFLINRFLNRIRPRLVIIAETELWPNFLFYLKKRGIPVMVVNARLSERSFGRYSRTAWFWKPFMASLDRVLAQSEEDGRKFRELGADVAESVGNLKYDFSPSGGRDEVLDLFCEIKGDRPGWIAGSTMPGEDILVLSAHERVLKEFPDALLLLAPRHPERAEEVSELCLKKDLSFKRRSELKSGDRPRVIILDTIGELAALYRLFAVSFVGGSLVPRGGHNVIEPAFWGSTIVVGPHMDNFKSISEDFLSCQALIQADEKSFADIIVKLIHDPGDFGRRAKQVLAQNRGALEKTMKRMEPFLS